MITVTYLIPTLDRSGAEKQLTLLAAGLPRDRFRVEVVGLSRGGPYERDLRLAGVPVTLLGKRRKWDWQTLRRLRRRLRDQRPDILHTWLFAANAYGRLARPAAVGCRTVVSERCVDSWKAGWQLWLDRRLLNRTDRMLANSESVAEFYRAQGIPSQLIAVIPNAVIAPSPPSITRAQLLADAGWPDDARVVVTMGRLARQKQLETALWGLQLLRQADERARLLILGDGPEREQLRQYARDVECSDFVNFAGHRDDASSLLHHCDVYWSTSQFEGMSNSVMEALACGVPVIASDIPPNRELLTHGSEGFLVNVGDGAGYAQYAKRLFDDAGLRDRLGQAGRQRMAADFSLDRMIGAHAALYESLAGSSSKS